jgi:hypothetical protein
MAWRICEKCTRGEILGTPAASKRLRQPRQLGYARGPIRLNRAASPDSLLSPDARTALPDSAKARPNDRDPLQWANAGHRPGRGPKPGRDARNVRDGALYLFW